MPAKTKPAPTLKAKPAVRSLNRVAAPKRRAAAVAPVAPASTKQSQLIALLRSSQGTSIDAMTAATGWQPHTVRGTISGVLRKRLGLNVICTAEAGQSTYRIVDAT